MNEIGRKITDKLIEINGSADFTIVFLPYKRSMWNSMESVYEECIASGADAHCMPIPYYRKKTDNEIDYIDSDFDLFGDIAERVELLDELSPRFIAIQYQYDGNNKVTGMLPEYYTANLKSKYNCDIVMLPYGIPWIDEPQDSDYLPHGIVSVDYIFTCSETARQNGIRTWAYYNIDMTDRIFAFGSPKLDMMAKAPEEIPDEWQPIIGDRVVTLVCNSLGAFLGEPYERINLYRQYVVREVDRDKAVIFRPHPLLRTTIKSMRPDTEACYNKLLAQFRRLPHVIIDESEYLERVVGIADHLISDPSSVVKMWQVTGKTYEVM